MKLTSAFKFSSVGKTFFPFDYFVSMPFKNIWANSLGVHFANTFLNGSIIKIKYQQVGLNISISY